MASNKGAELLESLKTQGLSQQEMLNRLDAIIDAESARPEGKRDRELIQACIDLQWFLTTGEHYTSKKEVARLKLDSALHKREKQTANGHGHSAKVLAAVFCLVAVVIVLPIAGQTLLSRKWIEGQTVDGGEVYRLNGNEVDPRMMKEAIAFMVVNLNINYRRGAVLNDELIVESKLHQLNGRSGILNQTITRTSDNEIIIDAALTFVCTDLKTQKALPLEGALRDRLLELSGNK